MNRRNNAAIYGDKMRSELDHDPFAGCFCKLLFNFRQVPVQGECVRPHTFITFNKKKIGLSFATCAAYATETVCDDAPGPYKFRPKHRYQRQKYARRIAARTCKQIRLPDRVPMDFRQPIDRSAQERRSRMLLLIELLVNRRILDTKIRAEIEHFDFRFQ